MNGDSMTSQPMSASIRREPTLVEEVTILSLSFIESFDKLMNENPDKIPSELENCKYYYKNIKRHANSIDIYSLTQDELSKLGFREYKDRSLMLVPHWILNILREGTKIFSSIDGTETTIGKDLGREYDFYYGLSISKLRNSKVDNILH